MALLSDGAISQHIPIISTQITTLESIFLASCSQKGAETILPTATQHIALCLLAIYEIRSRVHLRMRPVNTFRVANAPQAINKKAARARCYNM